MSNSVKKYTTAVKSYADYLATHLSALEALVALFNQKGHEYFGKDKQPFKNVKLELVKESIKKNDKGKPYFEIYTKGQFLQALREETGDDGAEIFSDDAAFDDSFRHAIFVNISDPEHPVLVEPTEDLLSAKSDWVLKWTKVQEIPTIYPDGNIIGIHMDTQDGGVIFFPIPTSTTGGRRNRRKTRKRNSRAKNRTRLL